MILLDNALWILIAVLIIDALMGDPDWLWRRLPHPVVLFGRAIAFLDQRWNTPPRPGSDGRWLGTYATALLVTGAFGIGWLLQSALLLLPFGGIWVAFLGALLMAQKSLYQHVSRVAHALDFEGLPEARQAVALIVGRETKKLDESGIARATIESLAENYSDGIVAPAFWFAILGLPGLFAYKMLNTADSMIGYRTLRYRAFGWASARADDLVNFAPARLSAFLILVCAGAVKGDPAKAALIIKEDAKKHRSPNAGWPEAAFAGALDIALSGPRLYATGPTDEPFVHPSGERHLTANHIRQALKLFLAACGGLLLLSTALSAVVAI